MDTPADHPGLDEYLKGVLRARVYDVARVTELDPAPNLSRRLDNRVLLKREDTQSIFSFKCRGAANWMARNLPQGNGKAGGGARVVAASAGNHAQGVAIASQRRGMRATLVMPQTTPDLKTRAVAALGAEVVLVGDTFDEAKEHAETLAQDEDVHLIPPFDDPAVICGQGTVAMEVLRQWQEPLHALLVPLGGGGLLAGILAYVKSVRPEIRVIGVEPANAACGLAAMEAGRIVELDEVGLFADGVAVRAIGQHCWPLIRDHCDQIVTVDTDEICAAVRDLFEDLRVIAEPAGALATAGLRKYIEQTGARDQTFVSILSGANTNFTRLGHIVERAELGAGSEMLLAVQIPERPGSFRQFCAALGNHEITEFNYRHNDSGGAWVLAGVRKQGAESADLVQRLEGAGYKVLDLSDDEVAKSHLRHMVGGARPDGGSESFYNCVLPARPRALRHFLEQLDESWNISLFHHRNHGAAYCRVLVGFDNLDDAAREGGLQARLQRADIRCHPLGGHAAIAAFLQ